MSNLWVVNCNPAGDPEFWTGATMNNGAPVVSEAWENAALYDTEARAAVSARRASLMPPYRVEMRPADPSQLDLFP